MRTPSMSVGNLRSVLTSTSFPAVQLVMALRAACNPGSLVGATMPSILVETAFLSNAQEESRLKETAYQEMAAEGILEGVRSYIVSLK